MHDHAWSCIARQRRPRWPAARPECGETPIEADVEAVPGRRPVDPYVIGIADRMTSLATFIGRMKSRRPPLALIHEARHILRERRRNG